MSDNTPGAIIDRLHSLEDALRLRRQEEWHDECGCVIWWGDEEESMNSSPWYVGSPLDDDPNGCVYSSDAVWLPVPRPII